MSVDCYSDGLFSDPTNCHSYIWCQNQRSFQFRCPQGTSFSLRSNLCEPGPTSCAGAEVLTKTISHLAPEPYMKAAYENSETSNNVITKGVQYFIINSNYLVKNIQI